MVESELKKTLINARQKLNLTHEDVANLANITRQYYGMIENGERNPSVNKAKLIAETLDIDWTIFFGNEGNQTLLVKSEQQINKVI